MSDERHGEKRAAPDGGHLDSCGIWAVFDAPDVQAPPPISSEGGAVSAIADHSTRPASMSEGTADDPAITTPTVEAAGEVAWPAYPNVPGCTCDRDDDSMVDEPWDSPWDTPMCDMHRQKYGHLQWRTLLAIVIDQEAALHVLAPRLPMGPEGRA